jgi:hypothetical protein
MSDDHIHSATALMLVLLLLAVAGPAFARIAYVDTSIQDASSPECTQTQPCSSISAGLFFRGIAVVCVGFGRFGHSDALIILEPLLFIFSSPRVDGLVLVR